MHKARDGVSSKRQFLTWRRTRDFKRLDQRDDMDDIGQGCVAFSATTKAQDQASGFAMQRWLVVRILGVQFPAACGR
jgi:hypothetical protein